MSDRGWLQYFALGVVSASVVWGLTWYTYEPSRDVHPKPPNYEAKQQPQDQRDNGTGKEPRTFDVAQTNLRTDVAGGEYGKADQHEPKNPIRWVGLIFDRKDTIAQWAMALLAVAATGLSGWAVWLLRGTLRLQREATDAAIKTLDTERRGYIGIKQFVFTRAMWNTDTETGVEGFHIVPILENSGNAPVVIKKTIISTRVVYDGNISGIDWSDSMEHPESTVVMGPKATSPMREIVSNLYSLNKILKDELRVLYMFKIEYANFFDRKITYHTNQCAELYVRGDPYEIFRNTERSPSAYLVMEMVGQYSSAS